MFAALPVEQDPWLLNDLPGGLIAWTEAAGSFAGMGVVLWLILGLSRMNARSRAEIPRWKTLVFLGAVILSATSYGLAGVIALISSGVDATSARESSIRLTSSLLTTFMVAGGGFAILAAGLSFFCNMSAQRLRRIYALARLSFKEAIRRRVLYAFSGLLLVFLFASWYIPSKHEDQVRTYVEVFFLAMSFLLLFPAVLVSSFSIPADIKQQTIHTIVTKPVERFEVVLGRFFGFLTLMTLVLLLVTSISLALVLRGVNPDAAAESLKAREPLYSSGKLRFENTEKDDKGVNVGREWAYRTYITKPNADQLPQTAVWNFPRVPSSLGDRPEVRCEYTFDVYRTTKGKEGADVSCAFRFYTWRYRRGNDTAFQKKRGPTSRGLESDNELTEEFGYYEIPALAVTDYHTQHFNLPAGLFRNASAADPERENELRVNNEARPPDLLVRVTCNSATQYVGMAKHDLYLRLDDPEGSETSRFAINFFKAAFGLWLRLALIIGLAVVLSTYLSGVISFLLTLVLYIGGATKEFIHQVALGQNEGGGPLEAMVRISRREISGLNVRESDATADRIVSLSDDVFRWSIGRILNLIPDIDRYDLTRYVAEGFNISWEQMLMSFLLLVGYLLPWAVLAYFLMKWREVASSS